MGTPEQPGTTVEPWWRSGVVYQVYPRSLADSDGDGVGDLRGVTAHLDHVSALGVDAVWLSPFYRSPMADFGYDVSDHCDVDPLFGTLEDADRLIAEAHSAGLRLVLDFVPNHTSDEHPWFQAARDPSDPHRDWYVWREPGPGGAPPNNWRAAFADVPAWTLDDRSGQYYLHLFLPQQPDLDWNHPEVRKAMAEVLRFWMRRGVDGFRADVVHCIGKDPDLPDAEPALAGLPACIFDHGPGVHDALRDLRAVVDEAGGDRLLVGETYIFDRERIASYLGEGDELHLGFNIPALHAPWTAQAWRSEVESAEKLYVDGRWPAWVLSNHDVSRHRTRFGTEARARAAAVLLLTLRGTPFLYAGEELGLADAEIPLERVVDPGGRDPCRAPIPWEPGPDHGWPTEPWLPFPPESDRLNVAAQVADPGSMLSHYRRLLRLRRDQPALHLGRLELMDAPEGVLRWRRLAPRSGNPRGAAGIEPGTESGPERRAESRIEGEAADEIEVLVNFTSEEILVPGAARGRWLGGTTLAAPAPGAPLGPDEARITSVTR